MDDLTERLCRSLAFHVVETELTLQFTDGDASETREECAKARELIALAGHDFDAIYPVDDRPTAGPVDGQIACRADTSLWCCHVRGPDDVHAAPDYETALAWSDRFNDWWHALPNKTENDPVMRAAPALWPWSAEAHGEALPRCVAEFSDGKLP